ncbi:MAG: prepilin-type N-terminal cleavage/methylation domain-containing protein [Chloroflexota bacterium]
MKQLRRFLFGQEKGITLLELVVVLSILAVVASIVTPAVGGQTTRGRASTKVSDIAAVQSAVDNFSSDSPANADLTSAYPINGKKKPSATDYHAKITLFVLPDGSTTTLYVKPIDFNAQFTATGEAGSTDKKLVPGYVRAFPKHSGTTSGTDPNVTITTAAWNTDGKKVFSGVATGGAVSFVGGKDYTPTTGDGIAVPTSVGVWVIDQDGRVWVLLDDGYY